MTDQEYIAGIVAGDKQAFARLYRHYHDKIFSTAFHYLRIDEDAEELTQDVFVELFRSASKYNFKASLSTWIYRITVNKCLDKLRYQKAKKRFALVTQFFRHEHHDLADTGPPNAAQDEAVAALHRAIDKLPDKQKTALILTQIEELSIKEAAGIMDISAKAVESLTQRAKANLRQLLKK
ncbi:MAG: RNA polymerase sigma factor [Sphingobacteriales bacterium]|nr:MAG: RNA polymerase sigma factor [Sphingobacteriales bacterium]